MQISAQSHHYFHFWILQLNTEFKESIAERIALFNEPHKLKRKRPVNSRDVWREIFGILMNSILDAETQKGEVSNHHKCSSRHGISILLNLNFVLFIIYKLSKRIVDISLMIALSVTYERNSWHSLRLLTSPSPRQVWQQPWDPTQYLQAYQQLTWLLYRIWGTPTAPTWRSETDSETERQTDISRMIVLAVAVIFDWVGDSHRHSTRSHSPKAWQQVWSGCTGW